MNLAFMLGGLYGIHEAQQEANQEIDLKRIDIDHLIEVTKEAKIAQTPEKYILDEDEKKKILSDLRNSGVDEGAVASIEHLINRVSMKRFAIMDIVNALLRCSGN